MKAGFAVGRVAVLGAGEEGTWVARWAAEAGYRVTLEDLMPARRRLAAARMEAAGAGSAIFYAASVEEAVRDADLVIDFVPDEMESKLEIFSLLDRMAPPHTILATPTRVMSIADLASCTYRGERCVGLRLPVLLAGCEGSLAVEVVHAPGVLAGVVDAVSGFWRALGAAVTVSVDGAALP
ncbi:MAG TPA: 3-hydroxyacyl-CoA dehydrogenase NAD-binding domain-containing protein [Acidobacteriaceae bacterium]